MKYEINVSSITRSEKTISIAADVGKILDFIPETPVSGEDAVLSGDTSPLTPSAPEIIELDIDIKDDDNEECIQERVKEAIIKDFVEKQNATRRGDKLEAACLSLGTITIEIPDRADVSVHDGKLDGFVGLNTKHLLVMVSNGVSERELKLTPNKNGFVSIDLEQYTVVSITPVGPYGVLGEVQ